MKLRKHYKRLYRNSTVNYIQRKRITLSCDNNIIINRQYDVICLHPFQIVLNIVKADKNTKDQSIIL